MDLETQFAADPERWSGISEEFPNYSVSNWGRVKNDTTGRILSVCRNTHGMPMVGLMHTNGRQVKRGVALLVARAFHHPHPHEEFNTPTHIDGNRDNNYAGNLMWRPLPFCRAYMDQFTDGHPIYDYPIEDVETGEIYKNSWEAAITNGLIDVEIQLSIYNEVYVFPTGQIFRRARQV